MWEKVHSERAFEGKYDSSYEGKTSLSYLWEKVYSERAYDGSHEGKLAIGLLSCLLEKVHSKREFEGIYDSSYEGKMWAKSLHRKRITMKAHNDSSHRKTI